MMDKVLECRFLYDTPSRCTTLTTTGNTYIYVRKKPLTPLLQNLLDEAHARYAITEAHVIKVFILMCMCVCVSVHVYLHMCVCVHECVCVFDMEMHGQMVSNLFHITLWI